MFQNLNILFKCVIKQASFVASDPIQSVPCRDARRPRDGGGEGGAAAGGPRRRPRHWVPCGAGQLAAGAGAPEGSLAGESCGASWRPATLRRKLAWVDQLRELRWQMAVVCVEFWRDQALLGHQLLGGSAVLGVDASNEPFPSLHPDRPHRLPGGFLEAGGWWLPGGWWRPHRLPGGCRAQGPPGCAGGWQSTLLLHTFQVSANRIYQG